MSYIGYCGVIPETGERRLLIQSRGVDRMIGERKLGRILAWVEARYASFRPRTDAELIAADDRAALYEDVASACADEHAADVRAHIYRLISDSVPAQDPMIPE